MDNHTIEERLQKLEQGKVYSTEEQKIGKWVDGRTLYRKIYDGLTDGTDKIDIVVEGATLITNTQGKIKSKFSQYWNIPNHFSEDSSYNTDLFVSGNMVRIKLGTNYRQEKLRFFFTIEYVK